MSGLTPSTTTTATVTSTITKTSVATSASPLDLVLATRLVLTLQMADGEPGYALGQTFVSARHFECSRGKLILLVTQALWLCCPLVATLS